MIKETQTYRILIVEDNPGDLELINEYLEELIGFAQVFHARDFNNCQKVFSEENAGFDVILLDLSLPDKGGETLIQEMLALCETIPVIVLTGYDDVPFSIKSLSLGISDYLLKDELSASTLQKSILYSLERKKRSMELTESEKRYSDLFHFSPQPMWVYEMETLRFLDVNEAAVRQYGFRAEEFLKMTIKEIRPADDIPLLLDAVSSSKTPGKIHFAGIFRHLTKDGRIISVDIQSNFILFKGKNAKLVLASDVTERLEYIGAIEKQNKALKDISYMQSHVLRAPVARLMAIVGLLQDHDNSEADKQTMLNQILVTAVELDDIIRKISQKAFAI